MKIPHLFGNAGVVICLHAQLTILFFPNSWYNYRVLVGFFRESLRGSKNPGGERAGVKVARPVFDDSSTLLLLFGLPVPPRCRIPWGSPGVPSWSHSGSIFVPFWSPVWSPGVPSWSHSGSILVPFWSPVWYQFGSSFVPFWCPVWSPVWSQFCSTLAPVWSQIGPSLVPDLFQFRPSLAPDWFQIGLSLGAFWSHFGAWFSSNLVLV